AAAVASLLGEASDVADAPPAAETTDAEPVGTGLAPESVAAVADVAPAAAPVANPVVDAFQFQRFSPYGAAVVGPLPGLARPVPVMPVAGPGVVDTTSGSEPQALVAADPTPPMAEAITPEPEVQPADEPATDLIPGSSIEAELAPEVAPEPETALQPEPLPVSEPAVAIVHMPEPEPGHSPEPEPEPAPATAAFVAPAPVTFAAATFAPAAVIDPFPPMTPAAETIIPTFGTASSAFGAAPALELSPPELDTAPVVRPVWGEDQRQVQATDQEPLFEDDSGLVSVLRHEEPDLPPRFDWSQTGAFAIMGGVGLVAAVSSAAAFRLSIESPSPMGETTIVAWTLAVIGGVCVVVSAWNLYPRLFPTKGE
ncbi:hypothetical protein GVN24_31000, partial [Rhizobium sp. CRIBSB]|nr:hypothetical protein [Rhizobium sp. CRIBSB]